MNGDKHAYEVGQLIAALLRPAEPTGLFAQYSRRHQDPEPEQPANYGAREGHYPGNPPTDPMREFLRSITGVE